jgi:hypothetical protein
LQTKQIKKKNYEFILVHRRYDQLAPEPGHVGESQARKFLAMGDTGAPHRHGARLMRFFDETNEATPTTVYVENSDEPRAAPK